MSTRRGSARGDRALVLVVLFGLWQAVSMWFGAYWVGSP